MEDVVERKVFVPEMVVEYRSFPRPYGKSDVITVNGVYWATVHFSDSGATGTTKLLQIPE